MHGLEEGTDGDAVVGGVAALAGLVVQCVEFALLEREANFLEQNADGIAITHLLEISLADAHLGSGSWVHQVDCLGLVTIVLVVSN